MLIHQEGHVSGGDDGCGEGCTGNKELRISSSKHAIPKLSSNEISEKTPLPQIFHLQSAKELVTTFYIHLPISFFLYLEKELKARD